MEGKGPIQCRVAIIGAQRARVAKVVSLISAEERHIRVPLAATDSNGSAPAKIDPSTKVVVVEYLPCVANFGSYENDNGETIRYLASVEYHGPDGKQNRGSSLAPFFDADEDEPDDATLCFPGVTAVAIGCGIESAEDVSAIETFVKSLSAAGGDKTEKRGVTIEAVSPNPEYSSMKEENEAYKALHADGKAEAARLRTIGPGKMAKFVVSLAEKVVLCSFLDTRLIKGEPATIAKGAITTPQPSTNEEDVSNFAPVLEEVDPTRPRFACRRCRTILFGEGDLEDPPHAPSMHSFSRRKAHGHAGGGCSSLFLASGVDWMGDMNADEGKFACPKCDNKLGSWKWAGTQCSCGTWVTPAIQVPSSKVDVVLPLGDGTIPGTFVIPISNF